MKTRRDDKARRQGKKARRNTILSEPLSVLRLSLFSSTGLQYWRARDWLDQAGAGGGKFYRKLHQLVYCSLPFSTQCWDIDSIYLGNIEITHREMLKYLWNRGQNPTSEREKLQKELFSFSKNVAYGFPNKPLAMDWDPHLQLPLSSFQDLL